MEERIAVEERLALVAGEGILPVEIARRLAPLGRLGAIYSLGGDRRALALWGADVVPLDRVDLAGVLGDMRRREITGVVLAGGVPKSTMYREHLLDDAMAALLHRLPDRNDHAVLGAVVAFLERSGFRVLRYGDLLEDLLAKEGVLGGRRPLPEEAADVAYGVGVASRLVSLSFGQTVVVRRGAVVAVEAMEGTDGAIERAGALAGGGTVVKLMRPDQDDRYDLPVVGAKTLRLMARWRLRCLAVERGRTLLLGGDALLRWADAEGIAVVGIDPRKVGAGDGI